MDYELSETYPCAECGETGKRLQMQSSRTLSTLFVFGAVLIASEFIFWQLVPYGVTGVVDAEHVYDIAIRNQDISVCDKVHLRWPGDISNGGLQDICYRRYAKAHPDQPVCARIANAYNCVETRAIALGDPSVCFALNDSDSKSLCLFFLAASKHDIKVCDASSQDFEKQKCRLIFIKERIQQE